MHSSKHSKNEMHRNYIKKKIFGWAITIFFNTEALNKMCCILNLNITKIV